MSDNADEKAAGNWRDSVVTFKHVVYAIPILCTGLAIGSGALIHSANAKGTEAVEKVAMVERSVAAIDAGVKEEVRQLRTEFTASQDRIEGKVDRVLERLADGGGTRSAGGRVPR